MSFKLGISLTRRGTKSLKSKACNWSVLTVSLTDEISCPKKQIGSSDTPLLEEINCRPLSTCFNCDQKNPVKDISVFLFLLKGSCDPIRRMAFVVFDHCI